MHCSVRVLMITMLHFCYLIVRSNASANDSWPKIPVAIDKQIASLKKDMTRNKLN